MVDSADLRSFVYNVAAVAKLGLPGNGPGFSGGQFHFAGPAVASRFEKNVSIA